VLTSTTTARYRIFDSPLLYYDSSYFINKDSSTGEETSIFSNGLSINYHFTSMLAGSGQFAWQTGEQPGEAQNGKQNVQENGYVYNASLLATPLPTLTDSLVLGGRNETVGREPQDNQSLFLNNSARLYKGIDVNLNVGRTTATGPDGATAASDAVVMAANVVPNKTMTWTFSYSYLNTNSSGAGISSNSGRTQQETVALAYTPVRTMYFFASLQRIAEAGHQAQTVENYGFSWAPFPDGALQFRFSCNENIEPELGQSTKIISPGVRYRINGGSFLDLSYQSVQSKSPGQATESKGLIAELRISL
jgi:hypothetical protein